MPTVLRKNGYRFHFYSHESTEPAHIHVEKAGREAKFWLRPVQLASNDGFSVSELRTIGKLVQAHRLYLENRYIEFHGLRAAIVAKKVSVKNGLVHLWLADGSTHAFPVAYYPRLAEARPAALQKVKLRLSGKALRWEELDEDIWIGHAVTGKYPKAVSRLAAA